MRNDDGMTPQERELEAALGGLAPARSGINRDQVMFCAGRASARRRNRLWQGLSSTLAILLLISLVSRSQPGPLEPPREMIVHHTLERPSRPAARVDEDRLEAFRQYVRTRRAVLDRGVDAIPASSELGDRDYDPPLTREHLDELLSST